MTDDWKFERVPNTYLGDILHIEASVIQYNHVPLRVFAHSCVATAVPDVKTSPRYSFIVNYGCLVDAKLTGSRSRFLPRSHDGKLQFELEAFRFAQGAGNDCCPLPRWTSAGEHDEMCLCCDSTCGTGEAADEQWELEASLGPISQQYIVTCVANILIFINKNAIN
ncbi:hypothetical protein AALO_G00064410 [Alosa alosa]|uniref:ZP domain-containing protein n=1 Tax=Alosa alosa TaxID=278164 RepID=A0AAV6H5F3_9TELE|nr:hypothetical protein AALO_G00064410 [Alosa alosa]